MKSDTIWECLMISKIPMVEKLIKSAERLVMEPHSIASHAITFIMQAIPIMQIQIILPTENYLRSQEALMTVVRE